jgi:hypothetical protein
VTLEEILVPVVCVTAGLDGLSCGVVSGAALWNSVTERRGFWVEMFTV